MTESGLEKLAQKKEETTAETIERSIKVYSQKSNGKILPDLLGVKEVKENLMAAFEQAVYVSKQGYVPILLLIGPSGSGKTELINSVIRTYKRHCRQNPPLTLKIDGSRCPYNENPYNLYRSVLSDRLAEVIKTGETMASNLKRPEICSQCESRLEKTLVTADKIELEPLLPQSSVVELGENVLTPFFINILKNANRSILTISADKTKVEHINPKAFQLLSNLYDNNITDTVGNHIPIDGLIIIHSNEGFMRTMSDDAEAESRPLLERIIRVEMRRNLSYSEEKRLAENFGLPFVKKIPNALEYISKFNVLSRIDSQIINEFPEDLDEVLELLNYYDSSKLDELEKNVTQSMSKFLEKLVPSYNAYLSKEGHNKFAYYELATKKIIFDEDGKYKSGWTEGVSSRSISTLVDFNHNFSGVKNYLSFSNVRDYVLNLENKIDSGDTVEIIKSYIEKEVVDAVTADVDYAILSFYFREKFLDYTSTVESLMNHLLNNKDENDFKDEKGHLLEASMHLDIDLLKSGLKDFRYMKMPLGIANYSVKFDDLFRFIIAREDKDLVKKESKYEEFLGEEHKDMDKTTEMYRYVTSFLKIKLNYFDEAVDEALKIYKEGSLFI
jgi:energy-coupling factor transporter ATP-binding protein EcfA2